MHKIHQWLFLNTSPRQTVLKNTFWLLLAEGVNKGLLFIVMLILAKNLGPTIYGNISYTISFVALFGIISDFGINTILIRNVSKKPSSIHSYLYNGILLKIILSIVNIGILYVIRYIFALNISLIYIVLYALYVISSNFSEFLRISFRPFEKMEKEAVMKVLSGLSLAIPLVYTSIYAFDEYSIYISFLVGGIWGLLLNILYIKKHFILTKTLYNPAVIISLFKEGKQLFLGMLFMQLYIYIDQFILGYYGFTTELGIYAAMYKIIFLLTTLSQLFSNAFIPHIIKKINKKVVNKILTTIMFINVIVLVFFIFWGKDIINLFYGSEYVVGYTILLIQIGTLIFTFGNHILYPLLNMLHYEKGVTRSSMIAGSSNLVLNIIFIPYFLGIGAATTTLVSEMVLFLLLQYIWLKHKH